MALTFYTNPQSRGQTVRFMLTELGIDYETVVLEYGASMKAPQYLAINPMGKVPALVHDGKVVTEAAACCAYLADAFPKAGLAPRPEERADYYRWIFFAAGPVEAAMVDRARKLAPEGQMKTMSGYGDWNTMLATLDGAVAKDWLCGERFTAADVYVGSTLDWLCQFGMIQPTANMDRYLERLRARPAYAEAKRMDAALVPTTV